MVDSDPIRYLVRDGQVRAERSIRPPLGPGQVRVAVSIFGLGTYPPSERDGLIGTEYGGRIVEIGDGVEPWRLGNDVIGMVRAGSAASELVVPATAAYPLADRFSRHLAPLALTVGLAALCLDLRFLVGPGRVALVLGPRCGTGCLFAGMIRRRGGTAVGWIEDPTKVELLQQCGFDEVIVSDVVPDAATLLEQLGGRRADLVLGSRMAPEAPWSTIEAVLTETGVATRRPASPLGDWDPARARVQEVIAEAVALFGTPEGFLEDDLAAPLQLLGGELTDRSLLLPYLAFGPDDVQAAYELSVGDPPESVIVELQPS